MIIIIIISLPFSLQTLSTYAPIENDDFVRSSSEVQNIVTFSVEHLLAGPLYCNDNPSAVLHSSMQKFRKSLSRIKYPGFGEPRLFYPGVCVPSDSSSKSSGSKRSSSMPGSKKASSSSSSVQFASSATPFHRIKPDINRSVLPLNSDSMNPQVEGHVLPIEPTTSSPDTVEMHSPHESTQESQDTDPICPDKGLRSVEDEDPLVAPSSPSGVSFVDMEVDEVIVGLESTISSPARHDMTSFSRLDSSYTVDTMEGSISLASREQSVPELNSTESGGIDVSKGSGTDSIPTCSALLSVVSESVDSLNRTENLCRSSHSCSDGEIKPSLSSPHLSHRVSRVSPIPISSLSDSALCSMDIDTPPVCTQSSVFSPSWTSFRVPRFSTPEVSVGRFAVRGNLMAHSDAEDSSIPALVCCEPIEPTTSLDSSVFAPAPSSHLVDFPPVLRVEDDGDSHSALPLGESCVIPIL